MDLYKLPNVNIASAEAYRLALEDERVNRAASGNLNVLDFVNKPDANGVCRVFGLRLSEEGGGINLADLTALVNDGADALLVREDHT